MWITEENLGDWISPGKTFFVSQLLEPDMELFLLYLTVSTLSLGPKHLICGFIEHDMAQIYST